MPNKINPSTKNPQHSTPNQPKNNYRRPVTEGVKIPNNPTRGSTTVHPKDPGGNPPGTGKDKKWRLYLIIS